MIMKGSFNLSKVVCLIATLLATLSTNGPITVRAQAQSTNQTKIHRIIVPSKSGFTQFVKYTHDPVTNKAINFSGFALEVFNESAKSFSFEFVAFENPDGSMKGTYTEMVEAVANKTYDGAAGDITIRHDRARLSVDFTVAYTDIGVSMLIPDKQETDKTMGSLFWLTKAMVIATIVFFFLSILVFLGVDFAGFLFGRRRRHTVERTTGPTIDSNKDDDARQIEEDWKREVLGAIKGTRLMTLLGFMILLFLITYYSAALLSVLTVEESKPPNKTLKDIIDNGDKVGYYGNSFIRNRLIVAGVPPEKLFAYKSETELLEMLDKGSEDGGVNVAIDETAPLSVFMARHCDNFTLVPVEQIPTAGYGFVFPQDSELVQPVSNGIINMIDSGLLGKIKARTIGDMGTCDVDPGINIVSDITNDKIDATLQACAIICVALFAIICGSFIGPQIQ